MQDVSTSITKINPKSQLFVVRGPPTTILPALFKEWGITHLVFELDHDPYTKGHLAAACDRHLQKLTR